MNLENKNPILIIKGFGTMRYQQIVSEINKTFTYQQRIDLDNKLPSEKRILGQMLITVAEYELEQKFNKWRKEERKDRINKQKQEEQEETKEDKPFDIREKLNPVPFTDEVK